MTVERIVGPDEFIGTTDAEPTDGVTTVRPGATFYDYETGILYITYDNGTTWVEKVTKVAGYEFTINGVNFNGYAKIKTLMLPSDCASGAFVTFHHYNDAGSEVDYQVPEGSVFIAYQALAYESYETGIAVVGETDVENTTPFTKEVLFLANGTNTPFMTDCYGVFAAESFVTASSISYIFKSGSALYGIEIEV